MKQSRVPQFKWDIVCVLERRINQSKYVLPKFEKKTTHKNKSQFKKTQILIDDWILEKAKR